MTKANRKTQSCIDCGERGETTGHMECAYPGRVSDMYPERHNDWFADTQDDSKAKGETCLPPLHIPGCEHRGEETGQEYAKRIKERDDAQDQRWTSGEV